MDERLFLKTQHKGAPNFILHSGAKVGTLPNLSKQNLQVACVAIKILLNLAKNFALQTIYPYI